MSKHENDHENYKDEIDQWTDMWDDMQDQKIHPEPEPMKPSQALDDFLGDYGDYYDSIETNDRMSDPELLQEDSEPPDTVGADNFAPSSSSANPLRPDSMGPDHANTPPVWLNNDTIGEIEDLRNKLFELENQVAEKMGGGKKWVEKAHVPDDKKLMSEIESLKKKLEEVSSKLGLEKGLHDAHTKRRHMGFDAK